ETSPHSHARPTHQDPAHQRRPPLPRRPRPQHKRMSATGQDLLVSGGEVIDGSGSLARRADVRIRDGVIAEIAPNLRPDGEQPIDAGGALVTPGFIELHTHLDPTLFWDR